MSGPPISLPQINWGNTSSVVTGLLIIGTPWRIGGWLIAHTLNGEPVQEASNDRQF